MNLKIIETGQVSRVARRKTKKVRGHGYDDVIKDCISKYSFRKKPNIETKYSIILSQAKHIFKTIQMCQNSNKKMKIAEN